MICAQETICSFYVLCEKTDELSVFKNVSYFVEHLYKSLNVTLHFRRLKNIFKVF